MFNQTDSYWESQRLSNLDGFAENNSTFAFFQQLSCWMPTSWALSIFNLFYFEDPVVSNFCWNILTCFITLLLTFVPMWGDLVFLRAAYRDYYSVTVLYGPFLEECLRYSSGPFYVAALEGFVRASFFIHNGVLSTAKEAGEVTAYAIGMHVYFDALIYVSSYLIAYTLPPDCYATVYVLVSIVVFWVHVGFNHARFIEGKFLYMLSMLNYSLKSSMDSNLRDIDESKRRKDAEGFQMILRKSFKHKQVLSDALAAARDHKRPAERDARRRKFTEKDLRPRLVWDVKAQRNPSVLAPVKMWPPHHFQLGNVTVPYRARVKIPMSVPPTPKAMSYYDVLMLTKPHRDSPFREIGYSNSVTGEIVEQSFDWAKAPKVDLGEIIDNEGLEVFRIDPFSYVYRKSVFKKFRDAMVLARNHFIMVDNEMKPRTPWLVFAGNSSFQLLHWLSTKHSVKFSNKEFNRIRDNARVFWFNTRDRVKITQVFYYQTSTPGNYITVIGVADNLNVLIKTLMQERNPHRRTRYVACCGEIAAASARIEAGSLDLAPLHDAITYLDRLILSDHPKWLSVPKSSQPIMNPMKNMTPVQRVQFQGGDSNWFERVVDLLQVFIAVRDAKDWSVAFSSFYLYLRTWGTSEDLARELLEWFGVLIAANMLQDSVLPTSKQSPMFQGWDLFEVLKRNLKETNVSAILETEIGAALWHMAACCSVVAVLSYLGQALSADYVSTLATRVSKLLLRQRDGNQLETFFQRILRFCSLCVKKLYECWSQGSWDPIFSPTLDLVSWSALITALVDESSIRIDNGRPAILELFNKRKTEGFIPFQIASPMTESARKALIEECLKHVPLLLQRYKEDLAAINHINSWVSRARLAVLAISNSELAGAYRVAPFALFIPGMAGIGKTNFSNLFRIALGKVMGFDVSNDTIFRVQSGANFPDGFRGTQWHLAMEDIDNSVAPASAAVLNHFQTVLSYLDNAPLNMEGAAIEDKGRLWANFLTATYTTNFSLANLKMVSFDPLPFWRRFNWQVNLVLKPQFRKSSGELDKIKAEGHIDLWDISVAPFNKELYKENTKFDVLPYGPTIFFDSIHKCLEFLIADFKRHYTRELANLAKTELLRNGEHCPKCGLPITLHKRPCVVPSISPDRTSSGGYDKLKFQGGEVSYLWNLYLFVAPLLPILFVVYYCGPLYQICTSIVTRFKLYYKIVMWFKRIFQKGYTAIFTLSAAQVSLAQDRVNQMSWQRLKPYAPHFVTFLTASAVGGLLYCNYQSDRPLKMQWQGDSPNHWDGKEEERKNLFPKKDPWFRVEQVISRPYTKLPSQTYTCEEFISQLQERLVYCKSPYYNTWAIRLRGCYYLTNRHLVAGKKMGRQGSPVYGQHIQVEMRGSPAPVFFTISEENTIVIEKRDLVILFIPGLPPMRDGFKLLEKIPKQSQCVAGGCCDSSVMVYPNSSVKGGPLIASQLYCEMISNTTWHGNFPTQAGDCGLPVLAFFGSTFAWVGIHGVRVGDQSRAEDINSIDLETAILALEKRIILPVPELVVDVQQYARENEEVLFQGLPAKSSLAVALTYDPFPCLIYGTIKNGGGTTLKSKVVPTWFAEDLVDLEREICGAQPYFQIPNFRGAMEIVDGEERWVDPFTVNLAAIGKFDGDPKLWKAARDDFLDGLQELACRDRVTPLSLYEAIIGVPTTAMGGTNLQTSAGAPFNCKKNLVLRIDHDTRVVEMHPELKKQIDRIWDTIDQGFLYAPACMNVLKDEAVSVAKNSSHKIRVFQVLPFAFNVLLKQYFGPISAFMRMHYKFFESAVGLDVGSPEFGDLLEWLHLDTRSGNASDNAFFDVKMKNNEWLICVSCIDQLALFLGYTFGERERLKLLLLSCMYSLRNIKGDVFLMMWGMLTGFWMTIFANCIRNSLQRRYCYHAMIRDFELVDPTPFRLIVRQSVLGDDNIGTTLDDRFNQVLIRDYCKEFSGVITDCKKSDILPLFTDRENMSFLKRSFVKKNGVWWCPIELKTLIKMLVIRRKSELSNMDHHAVLISNVMAEIWMHGEEWFQRFDKICRDLILKYQIVSNSLVLLTFTEYVKRYESGKLSVWNPDLNSDFIDLNE